MSITTMDELREFISKEMEKSANGEITPAAANASANLAGKMISSVKVELEYNKLVGASPSIKFLNKNKLLTENREKPVELKKEE